MSARCNSAPALRARLRAATQDQHALLDSTLGRLDLADRGDYARFLRVQIDARLGVEQWLFRHCPAEWLPPSQVTLLRRDLEWLGATFEDGRAPALTTPGFSSQAWIGAAWVLAGSSLGNKMMERDLAARAPSNWPMAFLRDRSMPQYFKAILPMLDGTQPNLPAEWAARAVFAHFQAEADRQRVGVPA